MSKELFSCNYPIYSVGRLGKNDTEFYVAGGGGQAKTGVPNTLDIHRLDCNSGVCVSVPLHHHDMGTNVIMNSAPHPKRAGHLVVGVGGECRAMEVRREDKGKGRTVRKRKKSQSTEEDLDKVERSVSVVTSGQVQTDFSDECYQRVVSFTCDGGKVVTGGSDGVIRVWEYPLLEKVCEFKGHENEIESLTCHPSDQQVISSCRNGQVIVWDLTNEDKEHSFSWSPGQRGQNRDEKKPVYRFRACCFSPQLLDGQDHTSLFTLNVPMKWHPKQKQRCYLLRWDAGTWIVEGERSTGCDLLSALTIDESGKYIGVGTGSGSVLVYTTDLKLLTRVSGVHTVFVTGLVFIPLHSKATATSSVKQVSKPEKLVLISVSADRTCSGTLVRKKSGNFTFILFFFIIVSLVSVLVAVATKYRQLW